MRFFADSMLGRLGRWLRLSGYDTLYTRGGEDEGILHRVARERRILLTRDEALFRKAVKRGISASRLASDDLLDQLRQLVREWGVVIRDTPARSRCPLCNGEIREVREGAVEGKIPEGVREKVERFWTCGACGQVYWEGTHWKRIRETVERL
jgi:hypothetical protein